jgi:hypothetical protein
MAKLGRCVQWRIVVPDSVRTRTVLEKPSDDVATVLSGKEMQR